MASYMAHEIIGYNEKYVQVCVDKRLKEHSSAQCGIINRGGETLFYSYSTLAATIDENGFLHILCVFSKTTVKHLQWFIREYCKNLGYMSPDLLRDMFNNRIAINIYTGEIKEFPFVGD